MVLADHVNHKRGDMLAWPSVATIARKCGLGERTVQGCLKELVALGELVVVKKGGGRYNPTRYRIDLKTPQNLTGFGDKISDQNGPGKGWETPQSNTDTPQDTTQYPADVAPEPEGTGITETAAERLAIEHYQTVASKAGWKRLRKVKGERSRALKTVLALFGIEDWRRAVSSVGDKPFYRGDNPSDWVVGFDHFLKPDKLDRLLENADYCEICAADTQETDRF